MSNARGAQERHPSARASGAHLIGPTLRISSALVAAPGPYGRLAAAALAVRGTQGRTQAAFAVAYGVDLQEVEALERGDLAPEQLPATLRVLTPIGHLAGRLQPPAWARRPESITG